MVDREGFEPSVPLPVRILSRDVVSANSPIYPFDYFIEWWTGWDSNPRRYDPRWFSRPVHSTKLCHLSTNYDEIKTMEVPPRFELGIEALQASALPLGDGTSSLLLLIMVPGAGLEPAQCCHRGILSPLRLPISPSGQIIVLKL